MGPYGLIPWAPIWDEDGWRIGIQCLHLAQPATRHRVCWERWRSDSSGDDYLVRVCDGCARAYFRYRHARRHRA